MMSAKKKMSFKEMINRDQLTLIDFTAKWCGPCQKMNPILKDLAKEVSQKAKIFKIDIDKNQKLTHKLNVRGVPTFILFKNGKMLWRQSGMQTKQSLIKLINKHA